MHNIELAHEVFLWPKIYTMYSETCHKQKANIFE